MKNTALTTQIISFLFTLALLAVSVFVIKDVKWGDYILMVIAALELVRIIHTLVKSRK